MIGQFVALINRDDVDRSRSFLACWEPQTQRHRNVVGEWFDQFDGLHGVDDPGTVQTAVMGSERREAPTGCSGEDGWDSRRPEAEPTGCRRPARLVIAKVCEPLRLWPGPWAPGERRRCSGRGDGPHAQGRMGRMLSQHAELGRRRRAGRPVHP